MVKVKPSNIIQLKRNKNQQLRHKHGKRGGMLGYEKDGNLGVEAKSVAAEDGE